MLVLNDIVGYKDRKIYQDSDTFSFCLDSLLLSSFVNINLSDKKILDLGTGNGIIPLIISLRTHGEIVGVEIQEKLCNMAIDSIKLNQLDNQVKIINSDMKDFSNNCNPNMFDIIVCNPPYFKCGPLSRKNGIIEKSIARHELKITLSDIFCISKKLLKDKGRVSIIHRVERFSEILELLRQNNIVPKRVQFIYKDLKSPAKLVMIEGMKNGRDGMIVENPIILYDENGEANSIYKSILEEVCE